MPQTIDMTLLKKRLEIPLIVHDILAGTDRMSDEVCYSMHAAIGDMKPHEALLTIALSTKTLLSYCDQTLAITRSLKQDCDYMIEQYAPLYLSTGQDETALFEFLPALAEDFQTLHARLRTLGDFVGEKNVLACIFCDIFSVQAHAQKMIADEFIELYETLALAQAGTLSATLSASEKEFLGFR